MPPVARNPRDVLQSPIPKKKHRTGRYIAVGAFLIVTLLTLHHVLLRDASKIAGIFVPTIIMGCYILWIAYSARRDKLKVRRRQAALAMQLTEVISNQPPASKSKSTSASVSVSATHGDKGKGGSGGVAKGGPGGPRTPQDNPRMTVKHNTVLTSVQERPVILARVDSDSSGNPDKVSDNTS